MKPGERIRMINVVPTGSVGELGLNVIKTSKIINVSETVLRPKKMTDEVERC